MTDTTTGTSDRVPDTAAGSARRPPALMTALGGIAWVLATVQYAVAQVVAASGWNPPYSWTGNYISDLGNTRCGLFAVPHGVAAYVCSPLHAVMNASFVAGGVLTIAGVVLLRGWWPAGRFTSVAVVLWIVAGLGKIVVGLEPENANAGLHVLGALNLPVGSVAILLLALAVWRTDRVLGVVGMGVAVVGLVGAFLSTAGQYAGPSLYLGAGVGGMERIAGYPSNLWVLLIGVAAILSVRHPGLKGGSPT